MFITVVINMKNPNALIAMALVSQNANNPYAVFCEYIKYCIFGHAENVLSITEIRDAVCKEFGIFIPYNVMAMCLSIIENNGLIEVSGHQVTRAGFFDTNAFDHEREAYRKTETALIESLIGYVAKYGLDWSFEYAREQLIKVLDKNGLAYDIFVHGKPSCASDIEPVICAEELEVLLPDEDAVEEDNEGMQPLYSDGLFVGRFIERSLSTDSVYKDYLQKVCEGLMLCVGAYQLPSAESQAVTPQIKNTGFFFDTRLLLRFVGCAGEAAVEAAKELVSLIQTNGGNIYYYPQTLDEMNLAFDDAIRSLSYNYPPRDEEMRLYAVRVKNSITVLQVKKANLEKELSNANIYLRHHETFTDAERIQFGFDKEDLQQYMKGKLKWDLRTIENDAYSLWETHMRRQGNYSEYCGSQLQLPVFVTTNSRLIGIALAYRDERQLVKEIHGWKQNRLPVITDIRLTCRLWSPAEQSVRLSLLYLTANAVAAQRPTRRYLDTVRNLAMELGKSAPEYSGIPLPSFFEDNVTDALLEQTMGAEDKFNLGSFAASLAELTELKAIAQEKITTQEHAKYVKVLDEFEEQTRAVIDDAVESSLRLIGWSKVALWLIVNWPVAVTIIFSAVTAGMSLLIGNWHPMWAIIFPAIIKITEICSASRFVGTPLAKWLLPKIEASINKRIPKSLKKAELPHKDTIIEQVKEQTDLWKKCKKISES